MAVAERFKHLARVPDLAGGGQVVVDGKYAYVGHMDPPHGTSILDISDPRHPKIVASIPLEGTASHSHKVRVMGDIMITNVERMRRSFWRRAKLSAQAAELLRKETGRDPTPADIAARTGFELHMVPDYLEAATVPYDEPGFKVWNIADRSNPKLIAYQKTGAEGVHRFDVDGRYLYLSTGLEGFLGNILIIYDLAEPAKPREVARWWLPGQNVGAGEVPTWRGAAHQLHHAMRLGDELWAGCWYAGVRGIDISDITKPRTIAEYDYHPAFPHPTHTAMRVPFKVGGRDIVIVIDEEAEHEPGQNHAFMWIFDIAGGVMKPISTFHVNEMDTPYARNGQRFGAHQFQEHFSTPLLFATWFSAGLRAVDFSNPLHPREVGHYIPDPSGPGKNVQSNDVEVDKNGLVYVTDRFAGLDILEYEG